LGPAEKEEVAAGAMVELATTDLCDEFGDRVAVAEPLFSDFGANRQFSGAISTCKLYEDNSLVREAFEEPGRGRVLVVDGGASLRCALVGDQLAALAVDNGWVGMVISGCVRDSRRLAALPIGVKALASHPRRSVKRGVGERDIVVSFAGISFRCGAYLYADEDGIAVSEERLL